MFSCGPLVVRFGALGDMVLLTPLLRWLHRRYGRPCRVLGSGPWLGPLLVGHPDVQAVLPITNLKRPYWLDSTQRDAVRCLGLQLPGAVYVCDDHATDRVRRLLRRAGVLMDQCRFAAPDCPLREGEHWIERWQRFAEMMPPALAPASFQTDSHAPSAPYLVLRASDREDLAEWLARRGLDGTPIVLLQPGKPCARSRGRGSSDEAGGWPLSNWVGLIRALIADSRGYAIVLCGALPEATLLRDLAGCAGSPRVHAVGDDLPLRRFMALCEHAVAMVSVDSGCAQIAAALGCPLIVMYGARSLLLWCPRSASGSPVRALGGPPERSRIDQITLDEVLVAWQELRMWSRASVSSNFRGPQRRATGPSVSGIQR